MDIFTTIKERISDLKKELSERLSKLPLLDQVSAANELSWALQSIKESGERAHRLVDEALAKMDEAQGMLTERVKSDVQAAIAQKKEDGEIILVADHLAALEEAKNAKEVELQQRFEQEKQRRQAADAQRAALKDGDDGMPAPYVDALPDEVLSIADFQSSVLPRVKARVAELQSIGIKPTMVDQLSRVGSFAFDEDGENAFRAEVKYLGSIFKASAAQEQTSDGKDKGKQTTQQSTVPTPKADNAEEEDARPVC